MNTIICSVLFCSISENVPPGKGDVLAGNSVILSSVSIGLQIMFIYCLFFRLPLSKQGLYYIKLNVSVTVNVDARKIR